MDASFLGITLINIGTVLLLSIVVLHNTTITKEQKIFFLITAVDIAFICIMELLTLIFDGAPLKYKWIHFLSNFLGFGFTPTVAFFLGNAIFPQKKSKYFYIIWAIYILWMILSSIFGNGIFYIDSENNYSRDAGFNVYVIFYLLGIVFFIIENVLLSIRMQYRYISILWVNFTFLATGTFVQIIWPQIHITWLAVSISTLVYYIYHNELFQQIDSLTGLFNTKNFLYNFSITKKDSTLIVIEIENFIKLRHNYSRPITDHMIKTIATEIKNYYNQYGDCYRFGSEEFCIIVHSTKLNIKAINKKFFLTYINNNYNKKNLTLFSIGYSEFSKNENLEELLAKIDISKREFLKDRLQYIYNN